MRTRAVVAVSGRVQGVFFRVSCAEEARRRGLGGYVRNLPDGRVEAAFEGEEAEVRAMVEWCRAGPPLARVDAVDVSWHEHLEDEPPGDARFRVT